MFVVALTITEPNEGAAVTDAEVSAFAEVLGLDAYTAKMRLAGARPRIVFQTPSDSAARDVRDRLRSRGLHTTILDTRDVVDRAAMVRMRRWSIDRGALLADDKGPRLDLAEVGAIVVFATVYSVIRGWREAVQGQDGAAEQEREAREQVSDRFAYLFPRPAEDPSVRPPWVLPENGAHYTGLGASMRRTNRENFAATLSLLRQHAPTARYDDRFAVHPLTADRPLKVRGRATPLEASPPPDSGVEWLVHLLAHGLMQSAGPYR